MTKRTQQPVEEEQEQTQFSRADFMRAALRHIFNADGPQVDPPQVLKTLSIDPDRVLLLLRGELPPDEKDQEGEVIYCLRAFNIDEDGDSSVMQVSLTKAEMIDLLITMTRELGLPAVEIKHKKKESTIDDQNV